MDQEDLTTVQNHFSELLNDHIVNILLNNCHLTKIQLETIYIDILAPYIIQKQIKFSEKVIMRIKDVKISRGAFIRTLKQAKSNIIKSINTILLLGYIGVFDTPKLQSYIELSNRLHSLLESYKEIGSDINEESLQIFKQTLIKDIQKGL